MENSAWELATRHRDNFVLSTYILSTEFDRYLATDDAIQEVIALCKSSGIVRVYIETFRESYQPERAHVIRVRDAFLEAGFDVAAAICTNRYGESGTTMTGYPCLARKATQVALGDMFSFAASIFYTVLIDEYIWTHCQCELCGSQKGRRSWTEFRCQQVRDVCREFVIKPAHEANPNVRLIYKFPAMYEELARQGQDLDMALEDFDAVWIGTEIGPFAESPQNWVRSQGPYRAYFLAKWFDAASGGRTEGSWVMPLEDEGYFQDSVYQTILAGLKELVIHPYGGLSPDYSWIFPGAKEEFRDLVKDLPAFAELTAIVQQNPPRGLAAVRTPRAEPWLFGKAYDANVFDHVGQLGIPLVPQRSIPMDAEGYFLSLHVLSLPEEEAKPDLMTVAGPILITNGLAETIDEEILARPNVHVLPSSMTTPLLYDYTGATDPYDIMLQLAPIPPAEAWQALADDSGWDISMRYTADPRMTAAVLGLPRRRARLTPNAPVMGKRAPDLPAFAGDPRGRKPLVLDDLRGALLQPFGITLNAPVRVSLHLFGEDYVVLHNFNDHKIRATVAKANTKSCTKVLALPSTGTADVTPTENGHTIVLGPHTLVCLRFDR